MSDLMPQAPLPDHRPYFIKAEEALRAAIDDTEGTSIDLELQKARIYASLAVSNEMARLRKTMEQMLVQVGTIRTIMSRRDG